MRALVVPEPTQPVSVTGRDGTVLVPAADRCGRPTGAFVVHAGGDVEFVPVVDPQRLARHAVAVAALAALAVAAVAHRRRAPSIGAVTMGPGGWISLKGAAQPPLFAARRSPRPWWARLLRAHRLVREE